MSLEKWLFVWILVVKISSQHATLVRMPQATPQRSIIAGFVRNQCKIKVWLKKICSMPCQHQNPSQEVLLNHCRSAISAYPRLHEFFGAPRFRNLAFSNYV